MSDYYEYSIRFSPLFPSDSEEENLSFDDVADVMSAMLAEIGFESFIKEDHALKAYIMASSNDESLFKETIADFPFSELWDVKYEDPVKIEGKDWNEEWEKNYFKPIVIGDNDLVIHSTFHHDYPECKLDVIIDPKMAFGTGNHSTTKLMTQALLDDELSGKKILDVGTGSGILAIIASKLGAKGIEAVEIDEFAWQNALENAALNNCGNINIILGDVSKVQNGLKFERILANINRNVILDNLSHYIRHLEEGGKIYLSGFYEQDAPVILKEAGRLGLEEVNRQVDNNWLRLDLKRKQ